MSSYLYAIGIALLVFPLIALLFTMPYIVHQYRKYGSILFFKASIIYSLILYLLVMYFLIILPLPSISSVEKLTTPFTQLVPFSFVGDFLSKSGFVWNQLSTYASAFTSASFYNVIFNIFLFMPLGIYLRYYFGLKKGKTILFCLAVSLFFELTQLSALYGIYPRPYRLFDVDDLLMNTLGGFLGYVITPLLAFLPSKEKLEKEAYEKGSYVSSFRRLTAFFVDFSFILILAVLIPFDHFFYQYIVSVTCYCVLFPYLTGGATIGKWLVKIKVVGNDKKATLSSYAKRSYLLYGIFLPSPFYAIAFLLWIGPITTILGILLALFFGILFAFLLFQSFIRILEKEPLFYEIYSHTKQISTVIRPIEEVDPPE